MRGGISLKEIYQMPPLDRQILDQVVKETMENVKKTKLPLL